MSRAIVKRRDLGMLCKLYQTVFKRDSRPRLIRFQRGKTRLMGTIPILYRKI